MEKDLEDRVTSLEVRMAIAESDIKSTKEKLDKIEHNTSWTVKLIIGTLLVAILNFALKGGIL